MIVGSEKKKFEIRSARMRVQVLDDGMHIVTLVGSLNVAGAEGIDHALAELAAASTKILVDLAQVEFVMSRGLGTLLSKAQAVHRRGGKLVIARPQPLVDEVLSISGLSDLIPVHRELEDAIKDLRASVDVLTRSPDGVGCDGRSDGSSRGDVEPTWREAPLVGCDGPGRRR